MRNNNEEKDIHDEVVSGLESTVGSFAARLQQKLNQKADAENNELAQSRIRQSVLLQGLKSIRKAFQETCRITLGNRFKLELHVDDYEGWPRLRLVLEDKMNPAQSEHALVVTAFNRPNQAGVEFRDVSNRQRGRILLDVDNKLSRLPITLKKQVRDFLDEVAEYVLNPKSAKSLERQQIPGSAEQIDTAMPVENNELAGTDLFMDDSFAEDKNKVTATEEGDSLDGNFHISAEDQASATNVVECTAPKKVLETAAPKKQSKKKADLSSLSDISFDS